MSKWKVKLNVVGTHHDAVAHRPNDDVAKQETDWTAMSERGSSAQEETGSNDTTDTDDGPVERAETQKQKGTRSYLIMATWRFLS